jgi:1-acyl-sn-glycerol-3-phosphate acyltransferase
VNAVFKHPVRVLGRLCRVGGELALAALSYAARCAFRGKPSKPVARALWMQHCARRLLRAMGVESEVFGPIPARGLLVCNHLSYVVILVIGAIAPAVFVAKREVKHWPVFGWLASLAGTIFVDRERRTDAGRLAEEIQAVIDSGVLVILFPEGTSSDGRTVLPFKSSLLEPAARQKHPITAGLIGYELEDGDVGEEVCYWKDMTLLPHMLNLMGKRGIRASLRLGQLSGGSTDRKELARQLHKKVMGLRETVAG